MGEHRNNPRAIEAERPAPRFPPGTEIFEHRFEVSIELNKEKLAEVVAIIDAARERGDDPRFAVPKWNASDNPEWFDYVVYNQAVIARPSSLALDPRKIPAATIRLGEHLRMPLADLRARVDLAFATHESNQEGRH